MSRDAGALDTAVALGGVAAASLALAPVTAAAWLWSAASRAALVATLGPRLAGLGVRGRPRAVTPLGGGRSNAVYRVALDRVGAAGAPRTVIVKQALPLGTVLATAARWVGPQPFAAALTAAARATREARALRALARAGVGVPALLAADVDDGVLVLEDVAGVTLPAALASAPTAAARAALVARYGRAVAAAHAAGVVLTDGHPGNALVTPAGAIVLIDLELAELAADVGARLGARRAFDLAYAAAYLDDAERAAFLAAAGVAPGLAAAEATLAPFAPLFERERTRQRSAA